MLPISTELIEILKHDYLPYRAPVTKQLVLYFADLDLTLTDQDFPNSDCFSLEDSLCGDELTFGDCVSACMKFQVENISQDLVGQSFTAKFIMYSTDIPIGTFIVSEAPQADDDNVKEVVAYDFMRKFDRDVTDWYNALTFPMTLKAFRDSLCTYCGVPYTDSNLPNDSMVVEKTISVNQLNGRDVLRSCEELNGCFGHMDRSGRLTHVVLSQSNTVDTIDNTAYDSLSFEEYTTDPISKVQIRQEDGDVGAYSGTGDNCYTITGNFLAYGKTAEELATIANNVATNILGITYRPFDCTCQGLPYQDIGDYITLSGTETVNTYIMQLILTGSQILDGKISAKGSKTLTEDHSLNIEIKQLQGKTNILKRDVEELSNTITDLSTSLAEDYSTTTQMQSAISQNNESVAAEVTEKVTSNIVGANVCDHNPITDDDICDEDGETVVNQLLKDTNSKLELLSDAFIVELNDNVKQMQSQLNLTTELFNVQISNLNTDMSTQIEMLENSISLKQNAGELSSSLSLENGEISLSGNRLSWTSEYSSMTNDGILTCQKLNAIDANISGTISSNGLSTTGSSVSIFIGDGAIRLDKVGQSCHGFLDADHLNLNDGSSEATLLSGYFRVTNGNRSSVITPTTGIINDYTILTTAHNTNMLDLALYSSPTYSGAYYATFSNTSGDTNVTTVGWVKAKHASDVRLKEKFIELDIYNEYMKLNPCEYQYKEGILDDTKHFGFKAQEIVDLFLPNQYNIVEIDREVITRGERKYVDDYVMRINYDNFHAMHVAMIQKQQKEINELRQEVKELKEMIA